MRSTKITNGSMAAIIAALKVLAEWCVNVPGWASTAQLAQNAIDECLREIVRERSIYQSDAPNRTLGDPNSK